MTKRPLLSEWPGCSAAVTRRAGFAAVRRRGALGTLVVMPLTVLLAVLVTGCGSAHHSTTAAASPSAGSALGASSATSAQSSPGSATSPVQRSRTSSAAPKRSAAATSAGKVAGQAAAPAAGAASQVAGGEGDPAAAAGPERCTIVSTSSVQTAMGATALSVTMSVTGTGSALCHFSFAKTNASAAGSISASSHGRETLAAFRKVQAQTAGAMAISGLGQAAYFDPHSKSVQFIQAATAGYVQASLGRTANVARVQSDLTAIARALLAAS